MRPTLSLPNILLACGMALLLVGCFVEEDTISISADGVVKFDSVVTVPDPDKKMTFASVENSANTLLDELRAHHWQITARWDTKDRPYQLKVSGTGQLAEVTGGTRLYSLVKQDDRLYRIHFGTPGAEDNPSHRRITFLPMDAGGKTGVYTPDGKLVTQIDPVVETDTYSIVLPPRVH